MFTGMAGSASADSGCSAGTYFNGSTCVPADPGYYVDTSGATSETPCPEGAYQPAAGAAACILADAGYYVSTIASTSETACPPGTYQPSSGEYGCFDATAGHYVDTVASTTESACPLGTYRHLPALRRRRQLHCGRRRILRRRRRVRHGNRLPPGHPWAPASPAPANTTASLN